MLGSSSHTRAQALGGGGLQTALESLFALPGGVAHIGSSVEAWASEIQVTVSERLFQEPMEPQRTDSPMEGARSHAPCFVAEGIFGPIRHAEAYQFVAAVQGTQAQGSDADDVVIDDAQGDISLPTCCETNGCRINGEKSIMPRLAFIEGPQQVLLIGERGAVPDRHAFRRAPRHGSVCASARDIAEGSRQALHSIATSCAESEPDAEAIPDRHAYTRRGKMRATGHAALRCVAGAFRRRASKPTAVTPMSVLPSDESAMRTGSVEKPSGASRLHALRWERSARFSR